MKPSFYFGRALATLSLAVFAAGGAYADNSVTISDNGASAPVFAHAGAIQLDSSGTLNGTQDFSDNQGAPGQTFVSTATGTLSSLTVKGGGNGAGGFETGNFHLRVSSFDGTNLTALATYTASASPIAVGSSDYFTFNGLSSGGAVLTAGATYAYDIYTDNGYFGLARSATDVYSGGNAYNLNGASRSFAPTVVLPHTDYDRTFQVGVLSTYGTTLTDNGMVAPSGAAVAQADFSGTPNTTQDYSDNGGPGQTFTPTSTFTLGSLTLKGNGGAGNGFETGNFNLEVSSVNGTTLTPLARFTASAAPLNPANGSPITNNDYFTFNTLAQAGLKLTAGQKYAFAVSTDKGYFGLAESSGDVLAGGDAFNSPGSAFGIDASNTHPYDRTFFLGAAAVPEVSTTLSFGLLLALGGLVLGTRKRKTAGKAY